MLVTEFIVKKIKKLGVKNISVFQGGAIMHFIDAIGREKGTIIK